MKRKRIALCLAVMMASLSVAQTAAAAGVEPDVFASPEIDAFADGSFAETEEIVFEDDTPEEETGEIVFEDGAPAEEAEPVSDGEETEEPLLDDAEETAAAEEGNSQEYLTAAYVSEEQFNQWKEDGSEPDMEQLTCVTGSTANIFELLEKEGGESTGYCLMGGMDGDNQPYGELTVPDGLQVGIMGWEGLSLKKVKASGNLVLKTDIRTPGTLELDGELVLDGAFIDGTVKGVGSADVIHVTEWSHIGGIQGVEKFSFEENGQDICINKGSGPIEFYEIDNSLVSNYDSPNWHGIGINIEGYSKDRVPVFHNTFDLGTDYYDGGNSAPSRIDISYINNFDVPEGQDWKLVNLKDGSRAAAFSGLSLLEIIETANRLGVNGDEKGISWVDTEGNAYRDLYDEDIFWPSSYQVERFVADGGMSAQQNFENYGKADTSENPSREIYWAKTQDAANKLVNADAAENPGSYYLVRLPKGGDIGTLTVPEGAAGVKYQTSGEWNEETQEGSRVPIKLSEIRVPAGKQFGLYDADIASKKLKVTGNAELLGCYMMNGGTLELNGDLTTRDDLNCVINGVGSADVIHLIGDWVRLRGLKGVEKVSFEENCTNIDFLSGNDPIELYEIDNSLVNYDSPDWRGLNIHIEGYSKDRVPVFHKTFDLGTEYYEDGNSGPAVIGIGYFENFDVPEGQDCKGIDLPDGSRAAAFADLSDTEILGMTDRVSLHGSEDFHYKMDLDGNVYKVFHNSDEGWEAFWSSVYRISRYIGDEKYTAQQTFENLWRDEYPENWEEDVYWATTPEMVKRIVNIDTAENPGSYYHVRLPKAADIGTLTVPSGAQGIRYEGMHDWDEKTKTDIRIPVKLSAVQVPEGKILSLCGVDTASGNLSITGKGTTDLMDCRLNQNVTAENLQLYKTNMSVKSLKCQNLIVRGAEIAVSHFLEYDNASVEEWFQVLLKSTACMNMGNTQGICWPLIMREKKGQKIPALYVGGSLELGSATNEETGELEVGALGLAVYDGDNKEAEGSPFTKDIFSGAFNIWGDESDHNPFEYLIDIPDTEMSFLTLGKDATANRAELSPIHFLFKNTRLLLEEDAKAEGNKIYPLDRESKEPSKVYVTLDGKAIIGNVAAATVSSIKDQAYTGKALKPAVTVTCNGVKLKSGTDYTLKYSSNKNIGTAKVTITGKGDYIGTKTVSFAIVPKNGTSYTVSGLKYKITKTASKNGTVTLAAPSKNTNTKITVPDTVKIKGYTFKVTAIANNAFKSNTKLKTVVIGKNVDTIGKQAFYGCKALKSITIKGTGLKAVGSNALKGINSKAVIKVPSSKLSTYKKLLKGKGQASGVKIQK